MTIEEIEQELKKLQNTVQNLKQNINILGIDFLKNQEESKEFKQKINKIYSTKIIPPKGR